MREIPALLAFDGGKFKGHLVSPNTKADVWRWIERTLDVPPSCGLVLSVVPRYAEAIAASVKRVEFRRKRMHAPVSHTIFYAKAPEKRFVCVCEGLG